MLFTQLVVFVILLFSPVSVPAEQFPSWLASVHAVLPIEPMAQLIRAGLAGSSFTIETGPLLVLIAWCAGCVALAGAALRRRG